MNKRCKHIGKDGFRCLSYAFNLYMDDIDQGDLCDVHYWQAKAQRTWVGLEGEEIRNSWEEATKPDRSTMTMVTSFARAIESKLKELNT